MRHVPFIDGTGLHTLEQMHKKTSGRNIKIILSGVNPDVYSALVKSDLADKIEKQNILSNIDAALNRSREILNGN